MENIERIDKMERFLQSLDANQKAEYVTDVNTMLQNLANRVSLVYSKNKSVSETIEAAKEGKQELISFYRRSKAIKENMRELTTFETRNLVPFIKGVLGAIEDEPYQFVRILGSERKQRTSVYYVIAPSSTIRMLITSKGLRDLEGIRINSLPGKYIILPSNPKTTLLKGIELDSIFADFPYLKDIAYQLIDFRTHNPRDCDAVALARFELRLCSHYEYKRATEK